MAGPVDPEDDKQHAMNVRRAKKMMQLFGDKPPKELFQIRSHRMRDDTIDTISILTTVSENRRDSRATFTSVTSSISIHRRLRDSLQSSNSDPPSPLVFSGNSSESRHGTPEEAKDSDPVEAQPKAEPEPQVETETETAPPVPEQDTAGPADTTMSPRRPSVHSRPGTPSPRASDPRARPTLASLDLVAAGSYSHSRSHSRTHSRNHSLHSQRPLSPEPLPPLPTSPRSPISGAPFSDLVPSQPPVPTNDAGVDPEQAEREREGQDTVGAPPENFRARRIRAAKLSRFFGVAPHDLTGVLASAPPASPTLSVGPYSLARGVHEGRPKTPRQDMSSSFEHSGAMSSTPSLPSHAQSERSKSRERPRSRWRSRRKSRVRSGSGEKRGLRRSSIWKRSSINYGG
ncbi:uncharacterized protein B0H18DRAFT_202715 [Fomitopsis serialis]|uniref:uncharacterized protein n=1 Tax=Fomitopsis serialis TaxID=139415 RepID=UPI0020073FB4|nr:uncharacterized protein B0H18DRAFT_202715 [Neoantrodia serialis]KAH9937595.1 hypothetical protein B0H18DRAFT_202715 [Neoantrodia serialis]